MRLVSLGHVLSLFALAFTLTGCPEKGGAPADNKANAEAERQEPDDEGKVPETKKPASAAPGAEEKKPDEAKDEGGW